MKDNYEFKGYPKGMYPNSIAWHGWVNYYAGINKLDPNFVASVITTESSWTNSKPNSDGARGIGNFTKVVYDKYPDYVNGSPQVQIKDICDYLGQLAVRPDILGYSGEDKINAYYYGLVKSMDVKYIASIHKNKAYIEKYCDGLIAPSDGKKIEQGKTNNKISINTLPFSNAITKWSTLIGASLFGGFLILLWLGNSSLSRNETL